MRQRYLALLSVFASLPAMALTYQTRLENIEWTVAGDQFECRLTQLIRLETKEGHELDQWLVIGEAVGIHIAADLIENGIYQTASARPILRGGGPVDYFEVTEAARFEMRRPG